MTWTRASHAFSYQLQRSYLCRLPYGPPPPYGYYPQPVVSLAYEGDNACFVEAPVDFDDASFAYRVRALATFQGHTLYGSWSDWSDPCQVLDAPPGSVHMVSPTGSSDGSGTVVLYAGLAHGANGYEFQEDCDPAFPSPTTVVPDEGATPVPSPSGHAAYTFPGRSDGTYYYRVRALNDAGTSPWACGTLGAVVTGAPSGLPPATPSAIHVPASSATGSFHVAWSGVDGATSYLVEEDTSPSFDQPVTLPVYAGYLAAWASSRPEGLYYYRVRAVNASGQSSWCACSSPCRVAASTASLSCTREPDHPAFQDVRADAEGATALVLTLTAGPAAPVLVDSLTLTASGSGDDAADVALLRLYRDADGDRAFTEGTDELIKGQGGFASDDGQAAFERLGRLLAAGATETWLVVLDLDGGAAPGSAYRLLVSSPQHVGAFDADLAVPASVSVHPVEGSAVVVYAADTPGRIALERSAPCPADGTVEAGQQGVVVLAFTARVSDREDAVLERIVLSASGSGDDAADIAAVRLAEDVNRDGLYTPGLDRDLGWTAAFGGDDGSAAFEGLSETVPAGGETAYLVLYDMAEGAGEGATFQAALDGPAQVDARGADTNLNLEPSLEPLAGRTVTVAGDQGGLPGGWDDNPGCCAPAALSAPGSLGALLPFLLLGLACLGLRLGRRTRP